MFTPAENPVLTAKYAVIMAILGGMLLWVTHDAENVVWYFWLVPLVFIGILVIVDRQEYKCPACGEYWALRVKGEIRLGEHMEYICRYCWHDFDPEHDIEPVANQGAYPPARGGEKVICYLVLGMAGISVVVSLFAGISSWVQVVAPLGMAGVAMARLKGWVKLGGGGGGGGGP